MGAVVKGFLCYSQIQNPFAASHLQAGSRQCDPHDRKKGENDCLCDRYDVHGFPFVEQGLCR